MEKWMLSKDFFVKIWESKEFQELEEQIQDAKEDVFLEYLEKNSEQFEKSLRYPSGALDEIKAYLEEEENEFLFALLSLGRLMGIVECFERILYEQQQTEFSCTQVETSAKFIKYFPEVIDALKNGGPMSHKQLGQALDLKPSTLTEAMKDILKTAAVGVDNIGICKVYFLTNAGIRYVREQKKKAQVRSKLIYGQSFDVSNILIDNMLSNAIKWRGLFARNMKNDINRKKERDQSIYTQKRSRYCDILLQDEFTSTPYSAPTRKSCSIEIPLNDEDEDLCPINNKNISSAVS